jgi:hypothetical protein
MPGIWGVVAAIIKVILGIEWEVKNDVEVGKRNPDRRRRIVEHIKLHLANKRDPGSG